MLPWQTVNGKLFDEQGYIGEELRSNNCNGTTDLTTAYKFAGLSIAISIHVIMVLGKSLFNASKYTFNMEWLNNRSSRPFRLLSFIHGTMVSAEISHGY